jgi:hypothetical protein
VLADDLTSSFATSASVNTTVSRRKMILYYETFLLHRQQEIRKFTAAISAYISVKNIRQWLDSPLGA